MPSFDFDRTTRVLSSESAAAEREGIEEVTVGQGRKCAALYNCVALTNTASYLSSD
jgi:hypothetical protein